jgi:hypothetical protein
MTEERIRANHMGAHLMVLGNWLMEVQDFGRILYSMAEI